jgi:hypothetical protein
MEFRSVLKTPYSGECNGRLQNLLATSSRNFGFQVDGRLLEPDAFWPTHFVEYLNEWQFMEFWSVLKTPYSGKCNDRLRIHLQHLLAILVFKLDDWNQMHLG